MDKLTDELESKLIGIIADGFNRSFRALVEANAVDDSIMRKHYNGIGSKYYDLVTREIECTAKYGAEELRCSVKNYGQDS